VALCAEAALAMEVKADKTINVTVFFMALEFVAWRGMDSTFIQAGA
jgi:hypothetical protein